MRSLPTRIGPQANNLPGGINSEPDQRTSGGHIGSPFFFQAVRLIENTLEMYRYVDALLKYFEIHSCPVYLSIFMMMNCLSVF
jgi:hypothetical protein